MTRDEYTRKLAAQVDAEEHRRPASPRRRTPPGSQKFDYTIEHTGEIMWTAEIIAPTARIVDHVARFAAALVLASVGTWPCLTLAAAMTAIYAWRITSEEGY